MNTVGPGTIGIRVLDNSRTEDLRRCKNHDFDCHASGLLWRTFSLNLSSIRL